jgi:hypothetical protein
MSGFLYVLTGVVLLSGLGSTAAIWPEGRVVSEMQYAVPIAIALNSLILSAMLAGLGALIDHVAAIRGQLAGALAGSTRRAAPRAAAGAASEAAANTVDETDERGMSADGRVQVLANGRVRQKDDGRWRVELPDGSPHPRITEDFVNMGGAKRALARDRS